MDGLFVLLVVLLVGFLVLGLAAAAGGVDSREFDVRYSPGSQPAEGD
jgi:hypothetical protein